MTYAAWLVIVIWGLLSLPLFLWLIMMRSSAVLAADRLRRARVVTVAVVGLSDVFCAVAIGWLMRGHWLVSLLIGTAFFLLRVILADWMTAPDAREVEITLSGADGEFREQLIRLIERKREMQLLRERMEEALRSGASMAPVIREHTPPAPGWSPADIQTLAGVAAACGAGNLAVLAILIWLMHSLARI